MEIHAKNVKIFTVIILFLFITLAPAAQGAIMTFDSAPHQELVGWHDGDQTYYVEDGIKMSLVENHYDLGKAVNIDTYGSGSPGSAATIKFEMADGSLFNLNSLNIHTDNFTSEEGYGNFALKYVLSFPSINYVINPGTDELLLLGMNNIPYYTFSIFVVSGYDMNQHNASLDNINMTAVPEPTILLLFGLGLVGLAGVPEKVYQVIKHKRL